MVERFNKGREMNQEFWTRSACAGAVIAALSHGLFGCGATGQKRQTTEASEVVASAVSHRSSSAFSAESPKLAMLGVLDTPAVAVAPVTLQVGSFNVFVHESSDVHSPVFGQLKRGDAVRKVAEKKYIVPPISSKMDDLDGKSNPKTIATWSYIEAANGVKGWVPTRALVTPEFYATSSEERLKELKRNRAGASGKGMVEKTKAKLFIGKGFGNEQELQEPNLDSAREIVLATRDFPLRFDALSAEYFAIPGVIAVPAIGTPLAQLDPDADARAAKVREELAAVESGKGSSSAAGLMATLGVQDDNAKLADAVARIIGILMKPRAPTPLEETGLGELAAAIVIGQSKVRPADDPVSAYVTNVGMRVAANCSNPYPATGFRFAVIDFAPANAIATPGGVILISTGLLKFLQSEDELATILGHEIAHIEERQAMLSEKADDFAIISDLAFMGSDVLADVVDEALKDSDLPPELKQSVKDTVIKQVGDSARAKLEDLSTELWQNAAEPGNSDECAADIRGIALAAAAGYDIGAMDGVLVRLNAILGSYGGASYSETRPTDVATVRATLPSGTALTKHGKAERWNRLQGLLSNGA